MITAERLAVIWPEASRRLRCALEAQGIDRASAEDLVSEAVTRALACGLRAETVDDFCRWAYRVARNLHVDWLRAGARLAPESEVVEHAADVDVTHLVEQRMLCESTLRSIAALSAGDRSAILEGLRTPAPQDRREAVRLAVRRHRARARLMKLVGGIAAQVTVLRAFLRQHAHRVAATPAAFACTVLPGAALVVVTPSQPERALEGAVPSVTVTVAMVRPTAPARTGVDETRSVADTAVTAPAALPQVALVPQADEEPAPARPSTVQHPDLPQVDDDTSAEVGTGDGKGICVIVPEHELDCVRYPVERQGDPSRAQGDQLGSVGR